MHMQNTRYTVWYVLCYDNVFRVDLRFSYLHGRSVLATMQYRLTMFINGGINLLQKMFCSALFLVMSVCNR